MKRQEITYTNMVRVNGRELPLKELGDKERKLFGEQIRTRPLKALGYTIEKAVRGSE